MLFRSESLYIMQFSLYIDNIVDRIDMQTEAWKQEENASERLFRVYAEQKEGLLALKKSVGNVVKPQYFVK